jgi:hypothetical protein
MLAERVGANDDRLLFVLNHTASVAHVTLPGQQAFVDLITGATISDVLELGRFDVAILVQR